ncbi:hypothetical protein ACVIHI_008437 [Bradyrhizobium sp. USDA 4524]|uniref:tyrosine-type recombinase/integrase n=1 Tax=unclassified Bradyrhizobium TaxID=2631580 RepID=UPI0035C68E04|nr:hypothetical protein [Bradyrhizobium sp. USDA 4538]MCP1899202.1 hypothetical protein [Bradyrhizobium sp. USDA 4537]MCP1986686.1 hypothetical protein [Bradyrhizobium sp. USDA 4539]
MIPEQPGQPAAAGEKLCPGASCGIADVNLPQHSIKWREKSGLAANLIHTAVAALRFTRSRSRKNGPLEQASRFSKSHRSPSCVDCNKHRVILTTCYAAGLRISEAVRLKATAIDSARMVVHVEQGRGRKDPYVMLSPVLLEILRSCWIAVRAKEWLFPGIHDDRPITKDAVKAACQTAHRLAGLSKPVTPHPLRRAFAVDLLGSGTDLRTIQAPSRLSQLRYHCQVLAHRYQQGLRDVQPLSTSCCSQFPQNSSQRRQNTSDFWTDGPLGAGSGGHIPPPRRSLS